MMTTGKHLINGQWLEGPSTFVAAGCEQPIHNASTDLVNHAAVAAERAHHMGALDDIGLRAQLLRAIAQNINAVGDAITAMGMQETALPEVRLVGERGRTTGQLIAFADAIERGDCFQPSHNEALPDRAPLPRPELRKMMRPMGPVVVFGASNFPLAFSTAGGDTASALAAGCPVIVKGHPAHPGTSELVAGAIQAAMEECGVDPGVFALIQDSGTEAAQCLVQHSAIKAVGFTGSLRGGRALFDLCARRPEPIPFYGEMGSINPVFVLPGALQKHGAQLAQDWVGSLTMGVGQFCTNPGLMVLPAGEAGDAFMAAAQTQVATCPPQTMLTRPMAQAYQQGCVTAQSCPGVSTTYAHDTPTDQVAPHLLSCDLSTWLSQPLLHEEVFGPHAVIVRTQGMDDMLTIANHLDGQLTATLWLESEEVATAQALFNTLERKAGRLLANGFPTGVEVAESMVHGGPYPASTSVGHTSVGTTAIQRFMRPVCYQNIPKKLLPFPTEP